MGLVVKWRHTNHHLTVLCVVYYHHIIVVMSVCFASCAYRLLVNFYIFSTEVKEETGLVPLNLKEQAVIIFEFANQPVECPFGSPFDPSLVLFLPQLSCLARRSWKYTCSVLRDGQVVPHPHIHTYIIPMHFGGACTRRFPLPY
jgi:hypothetical protein